MTPAIITTRPEILRIERRAMLAAALMTAAVATWGYVLTPAQATDHRAAVASTLFRLGEHLCRKNDGLRAIEAYPGRPNDYMFACRDGAEWPKVSARIVR